MTKAELIERYGIDWYEAHNIRNKTRNKERYNSDAEFREANKAKSKERHKERYHKDTEYRDAQKTKKREHYANDPEFRDAYNTRRRESYCRIGEYELIENYELAKAVNFKGWDIHHRLELTLNGEYAHSKDELKRMDMYYNRPYFELIFLRHGEHIKLHRNARH